jgi:lipoprotein signal peptidase
MELEKIGEWAFIIGVIIAVIAGALYSFLGEFSQQIPLVLVILGIVVGLLNIKDKETTPFLIAAIALLSTGAISAFREIDLVVDPLGLILTKIFGYIALFVAPAAVIVAVVAIYKLSVKA